MERTIKARTLDLNPINSGLKEQLKREKEKYCVVYDNRLSAPCSGYISEVDDELMVIGKRNHLKVISSEDLERFVRFKDLEHVTIFDEK